MKKTLSRRLVSVIISFALFIAMLAGCGNVNEPTDSKASESKSNSSQVTNSNNETSGEPQALTFPFSTTGEKLSIATQDYPAGANISNELPVFKVIKEKTGVDIVWEAIAPGNYATTMQTRLASGIDLPDMFQLPSSSDPVKLMQDGLIISINDLMKKSAPNMKKWFDTTDNVRKVYTMPDGKMYTIPMMFNTDTETLACYNNLVLMLREDWLKSLGLDVPKTTDELQNVLAAFKSRDPNNNSKADEIPFTGMWNGLNQVLALSWMYGIHPFSDGIYPDSNGKLVCDWQTQSMKEFLVEMSEWFKEGLIDADFMNLGYEKWNAQLNNSVAGSTFWFNMGPAMGSNAEIQKSSGNPEAEFLQIPTPSAPGHEGIIEALTEPIGGHFAISRDCKNPELAVKWLDYAVFSEDGVMYHYFGVEGKSFEYVGGKPVIMDSIKNDKDGAGIAKSRIGMDHHYSIPILVTNESLEDSWGAYYPMIKLRDQLSVQIKKTPKLVNVLALPEESERLNVLLTDLTTYRNEMLLKFISGETAISEFDNFTKKLGEIGMDEVLKIRQAQYDRHNSSK